MRQAWETTTGPLGQGITNAVGMALAEKVLAAQFNRPGHDVVDHYTYVFMGDGCMMKGSPLGLLLAGTLKLGKLVAFCRMTATSPSMGTWKVGRRPRLRGTRSYGWHVIRAVDGHDAEAIKAAIEAARAEQDKRL